MKKEFIICIIIIIVIIVGNIITQRYTIESIEEISKKLEELRNSLNENNINEEELNLIKSKAENVKENWKKRYKKLAYFIEHDELEKVDTNFVEMISFIKTKEYAEAVNELDKNIFVLKHIEDKYALKLENIF